MKFICIVADILLISHAISKLRFEPMWKWAFRFLNAIRREMLRTNFFSLNSLPSIYRKSQSASEHFSYTQSTAKRKFVTREQKRDYSHIEICLRRRDVTFEINYSLLVMRAYRSADDNLLSRESRQGFLIAIETVPRPGRYPRNVVFFEASPRQARSPALLMIDRGIVVDATRATIKLAAFSKSNRPLSFTLALKRVLRYISGRATLTFCRILRREQIAGNAQDIRERIREDEWVCIKPRRLACV